MKVGEIALRVPQERSGQFSTRVFEHYQRSEKALVVVLSEMYVHGVSTRRVSRLAEGLCGHEFSPATISTMVSKLDVSLKAFAERRLEEAYPYVVLEMACPVMKEIFAKYYTRTATWEHLRGSFCAVAFRNWQELYGHALEIYTAYLAYDTI